jgi:hypothetical protein
VHSLRQQEQESQDSTLVAAVAELIRHRELQERAVQAVAERVLRERRQQQAEQLTQVAAAVARVQAALQAWAVQELL